MKLKRKLLLSKTCLHLLSSSVMRSHFSSFLLLHSNSQMANVLSSPAKNASGIPTSKPFTAFGNVNRGLSDTWEEAVKPLTLPCSLRNSDIWQKSQVIVWPSLIIHSLTLSQCKHYPILHFMRPGMDKKLLLSNGVTHKEKERRPILFTALQTTNYAHIVKTHPITMHNEACSRTVINSDSLQTGL